MFTQRNVQNLFIGNSPVALATGDLTTINVGQVAAFTPEGVRLTTTTAATENKMVIGMKLPDGKILLSDVIEKSKIESINAATPVAAAEQVDVIGFNGTAGSIDVINDNLYKLNIYVEEFIRSNTDGKKVKFGIYQSSLAASQGEIAFGIANSVYKNFNREAERFLLPEVLNSGTVETAPGVGNNIQVVNGSNKVTFVALPVGTVVGDLLRIGTGASAVVYRIENISGTTMTIDRPFTGATGQILVAGHNYVLGANIGANYGVRFTGQPLSFIVGKKRYEKARWTLNMVDFGNTTYTSVAQATLGRGRWQQISELEWFTFGNEGETFRRGEPTIYSFRDIVNPAFAYGMIQITFYDDSLSGFQKPVSPKVLTIAVPGGGDLPAYSNGTGATDLLEVLEVFGSATLTL
jgi:hypothetical protein